MIFLFNFITVLCGDLVYTCLWGDSFEYTRADWLKSSEIFHVVERPTMLSPSIHKYRSLLTLKPSVSHQQPFTDRVQMFSAILCTFVLFQNYQLFFHRYVTCKFVTSSWLKHKLLPLTLNPIDPLQHAIVFYLLNYPQASQSGVNSESAKGEIMLHGRQ